MLANSVREASSPLRVVGAFLGIFLFDFEKFYFNRLYMIAVWTFYACVTYRAQIFFNEERLFINIIGMLVMHGNGIIAVVAAFSNARYKKTSDKCFKVLCAVDDTLKSLGISLEYQTLYRRSLLTLILLVLLLTVGISGFILTGSGYFYSFRQALCVASMFAYQLFLTIISDFNYWIVLRSIESRFDRLNRYVDDLSAKRENHVQTFCKTTCFILESQRNADFKNHHCKVWIIMKLHLQLNKTSREINRMFSVDFGLQMGIYFFTTIELISFIYMVYVEPNRIAMKKALFIVVHVMFNLFHFTKLVLINCSCDNIQRKSNGMQTVLTNCINTVHDPESWQEIHQFLMQVKQRPLQFTALGFINLGNKCVISLFMSMTETVIIMIQLGGMTHASYVHPEHNTTIDDSK